MRNTKKIISAIILVAVLSFYLFQDRNTNPAPVISNDIPTDNTNFHYLPSSTTNQIVKHQFYTLSYSEKHEQAEWVAYSLDKKDIVYTNHKRPYFIYDPKVKTKSANYRNYKKSGYDRGHLCPAAGQTHTFIFNTFSKY